MQHSACVCFFPCLPNVKNRECAPLGQESRYVQHGHIYSAPHRHTVDEPNRPSPSAPCYPLLCLSLVAVCCRPPLLLGLCVDAAALQLGALFRVIEMFAKLALSSVFTSLCCSPHQQNRWHPAYSNVIVFIDGQATLNLRSSKNGNIDKSDNIV